MSEEETNEELSPEEMEALEQLYGYPKEEEKQSIFAFFKKVITMRDSSRTANLTNDEIGTVRNSVRTFQELALYCKEMSLTGVSNYFDSKAQIILGTSLSREGFLDRLAVTQKRETESKVRKPMTQNKGWFKKKEPVLT